jgi:hypothetical protein
MSFDFPFVRLLGRSSVILLLPLFTFIHFTFFLNVVLYLSHCQSPVDVLLPANDVMMTLLWASESRTFIFVSFKPGLLQLRLIFFS